MSTIVHFLIGLGAVSWTLATRIIAPVALIFVGMVLIFW